MNSFSNFLVLAYSLLLIVSSITSKKSLFEQEESFVVADHQETTLG
jgi:hypothetical protein